MINCKQYDCNNNYYGKCISEFIYKSCPIEQRQERFEKEVERLRKEYDIKRE